MCDGKGTGTAPILFDLRPLHNFASRKGGAIIKRERKHPLYYPCLKGILIAFVIGMGVFIVIACEPRQAVVIFDRQDQPDQGNEMLISADQALEIASEEIRHFLVREDPMFAPWSDASLGQPVLVKDVFKNPSYWLVPVLIQEQVAGFVRILGTGRVAAIGSFYKDPKQIEVCPAIVTGIDSIEASRRAEERIRPEQGDVASEPVFVHDGPPGREAWLIEILKDGKTSRWIFVTPAFVYERLAGELLNKDLE